jgi:hypothetical protein
MTSPTPPAKRGRITLPSGIQIDMASVDYVNVACDRVHLRGEEQGWLVFDAADAAAIRGQHESGSPFKGSPFKGFCLDAICPGWCQCDRCTGPL